MNRDEQLGKTQIDAQKASSAHADPDRIDPALQAALAHFRRSLHAWSDAEFHRVRPAIMPSPHRATLRRAFVWALGIVLVAGSASTGVYEHHRHVVQAEQARQRQIEHQRQLAQQHARDEEDLLARVDSDVSREVPAAMEPLLLADDNTQ